MSTNQTKNRERQRKFAERKRAQGYTRETLWVKKELSGLCRSILAMSADDIKQIQEMVKP